MKGLAAVAIACIVAMCAAYMAHDVGAKLRLWMYGSRSYRSAGGAFATGSLVVVIYLWVLTETVVPLVQLLTS